MKLTILYDNNSLKEGLREGWGFSCLIEAEKNILFDTGFIAADLKHNMRELGYSIEDIDVVVLSHQHWDHMGGVTGIINHGQDLTFYVPASFSKNLKGEIRKKCNLYEVTGPQKITESVYTTGELKAEYKGAEIAEQSLVLKAKEGVVAVTGCSHAGVKPILGQASKIGKPYGIVGGLHGFDDYELLSDMKLIVPTHCTKNRLEIRERYPQATMEGGVGFSIDL